MLILYFFDSSLQNCAVNHLFTLLTHFNKTENAVDINWISTLRRVNEKSWNPLIKPAQLTTLTWADTKSYHGVSWLIVFDQTVYGILTSDDNCEFIEIDILHLPTYYLYTLMQKYVPTYVYIYLYIETFKHFRRGAVLYFNR